MRSLKKSGYVICLVAFVCASCAALLMQTEALTSARAEAAITPGEEYYPVCGPAPAGYAQCEAMEPMNPASGSTNAPTGLTPANLQSAYQLPSIVAGQGQTVAIVDAYDDPNAESDLAVYRSYFHLPPCTSWNGCFRKVDQNGGRDYPNSDANWAKEMSLDMDMVSAICPLCHILVVEASEATMADLAYSVDTAVRLGATEVSNSYIVYGDSPVDEAYAPDYNHPGVIITAGSGDGGYASGTGAPAAYPSVVAVGGTSLTQSSTARGWSETAWSGTGSGCTIFARPAWQQDSGCSQRTVADVSAVADPKTGVSMYDTYAIGQRGWLVVGGTSAATPIIASVYALAGNAHSLNAASSLYSHSNDLNDVTSGSTGTCGTYLCNAGSGYDGPTGMGTPAGLGAF